MDSKGFDLASDDILCSYTNSNSNGIHSDSKETEFHKSRMSRIFPTSSYTQPDDYSHNQDAVIAAVERSMKKHSDNLMRFLEGLSSRLSQLELYCYNVDKSIGEMRSDLARDHDESEAKLKFLEKHLQEVHRSVQIIRDKQELADTQKELAKLQLAQKDGHESQKSDETSSTLSSDTKRNENASEGHGQQLALALPHQIAPQPVNQPQNYYLPPPPLPNVPAPTQPTRTHYQSDPHYPNPPPPRSQPIQPQYQQQWAQQVQPPPPAYLPSQQTNPSTPETLPNNMPMQMTYPFGGPGRTPQQPPQQGFGGQPNDGYAGGGRSNVGQGNAYMMYESEGGRVPHPTHFSQSVYPPNPQQNGGGSMMGRPPPQFMRSHPYNELIDKLGSMGYRGEHVMSVIQRLEESGQTVDFNTVLDKLNAHPSQGGWSG